VIDPVKYLINSRLITMNKFLLAGVLALSMCSISEAGLLGEYMSEGGTLTSTVGYLDFSEQGSSATASAFEAGDIVYMFQKFSTAGVSGSGSAPNSLYGVWAFKGGTEFDDNVADVANRPSIELGALDGSGTAFGSYLTGLGISTTGASFTGNSVFALISSSSTVSSFISPSSFFGQGFEVDLVGGLNDGLAEFQFSGLPSSLDYTLYQQPTPGAAAFSLIVGATIEWTDDGTNLTPNTSTVTGFDRRVGVVSTASANILMNNTPAVTRSITSTSFNSADGNFDGTVAMTLNIPSAVPEPNSMAIFAIVGLAGAVARRRRK
jgi:hypothetical protein